MKSHWSFSGAARCVATPPSLFSFLFQLSLISAVLAMADLCATASAQTNEWVWMGGSNTQGKAGVYGTQGTGAMGNVPGARAGSASAMDSEGNFWLFGGLGFDSAGNFDPLNDLWEFNPSTSEWTWVSGSSTATCWPAGISYSGVEDCGQKGVYGTQSVAAPANVPGARSGSVAWADSSGNLWIFGGYGYDSAGVEGPLNDLWEFNPSTLEWTWMGGGSTFSICGYSGNEGYPFPCPMGANGPTGRDSSANWIDSDGGFWLFGGEGLILPRSAELGFNDLQWFNASTGEWEKKTGCTEDSADWGNCSQSGTYGTLGVASSQNSPGARYSSSTWTDKSGNLWLFGGNGTDSAGNIGTLNDLWKFDPAAMQWTWIGGGSTLTCSTNGSGVASCAGQSGVYGTLGVPASGNYPGARSSAVTWTDKEGNLWLFGGNGYDSGGTAGDLNDLWVFNPLSIEWAWMAGNNTIACTSIYGTTYCGQPGVYGELGIAATGNTPGGRYGSVAWKSSDGNLWLFGGDGYDSVGAGGLYNDLNDLWEFQPSAPVLATAAPSFSPAGGTYTSDQTVTISDSTPNATIYYTTDGSIPTVNSTAYSGAIAVSSTETIQAVASAPGYSLSAVASANYTINLPPTFDLGMSPSSLTIAAGGEGTMVVTVRPQNGFSGPVSFACSGVPSGSSCTFTLATLTLPGTTTTTLMISAATRSAALDGETGRPIIPGGVLAVAFVILRWKRTRVSRLMPVLLFAAASGFIAACGSSSKPASQPVTSTVTITASSASVVRQATFTLTVD